MNATAIKWHGGKAYLADWIVSHFPPRDSYIVYAEPYFGGGSVLFAHDSDGKSEVVNDINRELTNFWRVLQADTGVTALRSLLSCVPFSQVEFEGAEKPETNPARFDSVREAARFFIRNRQSRQGLGKDFATPTLSRTRRGMNEQASAWLSAIDGLPEFHTRLKRVQIYCEAALRFIDRFDAPTTLFYLDPPYLHDTRTVTDAYEHEMDEADHRKLLNVLASIKGRFVLSGYPSRLYGDYQSVHDWRRVSREIDNKSGSGKTKQKRLECLWMNY